MMIKTKNRFYLFREKKREPILSFRTLLTAILFTVIYSFGFNPPPLHGASIDIADAPLDVQLQASAPNLMFGLDDSGSMDWEVLTTETDGLFHIGNTDYEYVFDDPGDNLYTSGTYSHVITGDTRRYWKSQWSGYNVMYYDPTVTYVPWHSAMADADPDNVRSHPMYAENYTNLNASYYLLAPSSIEIIKDDRDNKGITKSTNWLEYIDPGAYLEEDYYTATIGATFKWTPTILSSGEYEVRVFNTFYSQNDYNAEYTIVHANGTSIAYSDQYGDADTWDLLGTFSFNAGTTGSVTVTRKNHPTKNIYTNADAVKFTKVTGSVNVINAHYFVQSATAGKPYLVVLNGDIKYYKYTDDGDAYVEAGELVLDAAPPADVVTGRTYAQERQNFANWYSFYRKRWGVAMSAACQSIEMLEGVNVGIRSINGYIIKKVVPIKVGGLDETATLLNILSSFRHTTHAIGTTPLRQGLKKIGEYYSTSETINPAEPELDGSPLDAGAGGGCQQNFAIMFTDGAYNGTAPGLGNVDGTFPAPYKDQNSASLADVAMYYWMTDLDGDDTNNQVPTNFYDTATWQHMVTYTIGFGLKGTLDQADYDLYNIDSSQRHYPTWPSPINSDYERIDDLWHAAVNGRGFYLSAQNPQELIASFLAIINDVIARIGSGAKVSINSEELDEGTAIYQSSYSTEYWSGDVKAYTIDPATGEIRRGEGEELWSASEKLATADWNTGRVIATYNGTSSTPFRFGSLTATQKSLLDPDPAVAEKMVEYLRGNRSLEGVSFRIRESNLGDFVHSAPTYENGILYVGGNDGMLHAFNGSKTTGGNELFAYVPGLVFPNLSKLADPAYSHKYFVDLTPFIRTVNAQTLLVGGLGKGGKGYYCLDVTDPLTITSEATLASRVKWEFPKATTAAADVADMGYSFSRPAIVNTAAGWVVLFGNGYNSPNEHAVLFVLSTSGTVLAKIDTLSGPSNGLSTPAVVDVNSDSLADYVYVGDLLGNLWKFDIQAASAASWKSAYESSPGVPAPLFTARGPGGAIQPITTKPDAMYHCKRHGTIVVFGTGKYLGSSDFADVSTQTLYGIWDYGDDSDDAEYLGTFNRATVPNLSNQPASVSLLEQVELVWASFGGRFMRVTSDYAPTWATEDESPANGGEPNLSSATSNHAGWYFDLPLAKERIIRDLQIRSGMAIVITTIPKSIPCTAGGESILMEIQACTGARPYSPQLDINEDGLIDENDKVSWNSENLPPSGLHSPTLLYEPTILRAGDQELKLMSTAAGGIVTQRERGEGRGMFFWREIK